jgi:hypothetical protein
MEHNYVVILSSKSSYLSSNYVDYVVMRYTVMFEYYLQEGDDTITILSSVASIGVVISLLYRHFFIISLSS